VAPWLDARDQRFSTLDELNAWLAERCRALWAELRHPEHKAFSVAEMLELERQHLMPMPAPFDGYVQEFSRVSSTCLVTVARNRYSVPCEWARHTVSTRLYPGRVVVVAEDRVVAEHERQPGKGKTVYDWMHYVPLLQRKPRGAAQRRAVQGPARAAGPVARSPAQARRRRPADGAGAGPGEGGRAGRRAGGGRTGAGARRAQRPSESRTRRQRAGTAGTGEDEVGVVVHSWKDSHGDEDVYVAFFGPSFPAGEPQQAPYLLQYYSTSLEVIG
jgi:hypothetical protein